MRTLTALILFFCTAPWGVAAAQEPTPSMQFKIARWLRPSIAENGRAARDLEARLAALPPITGGRRGASTGYHSQYFKTADSPLDIVMDLGETKPIDRVAVFSVYAVFQGESFPRYGFPERFVIEAAQDPAFERAELLLDSAEAPPTVHPKYPVQAATPGLKARYLRLRVLEHWRRSDGVYFTALGEIMALSGGRNVAIGARVEAESFTSLPDWSRENLVDGQTDLGLPVGPEPSASNGFLSIAQRWPRAKKWVQVDLGRPAAIDEVRLIPSMPFDAPSDHGHGFPMRFRVVASETPGFETPRVLADHTEAYFPTPGDNAVVVRSDGRPTRYVRLETEALWHITNGTYALALAEMQVYEGDRNVALGADVSASDVLITPELKDIWNLRFLVDGYSSQNRLIELDAWLEGLEERAATEWEIAAIRARTRRTVLATTNTLLVLAAAVIAGLCVMTSVLVLRRKRALARQRDEMRTRIARDLHDDLGSRLGGIRLLSENLLTGEGLPDPVADDLELIHRASGEATDAMRDIVWFLTDGEASRAKLVDHLRHLAPSILGGVACEFQVEDAPEQQLGVDFRRQVLFAFKECLGNAAKHAKATRVDCRIGGGAGRFRFEVRDDGEGFAVGEANGGHGLNNLRTRAESLGGGVTVTSRPGEGTRVVFEAPIQNGKRA